MVTNNPSNAELQKATIGDSNIPVDYPWQKAPNLSVFVNLENVSIDDKGYYSYIVLLALKWWEMDRSHNLSYNPNFKIINDSNNANIIIYWNNTVSSSPTDRGYTHINSSGVADPLGEKLCDTYNLPYLRCIIEIHTNLSYEENLFVVKHELGHALGLKHIFNKNDFLIRYHRFNTNYFLSPSEIMFDNERYYKALDSIKTTENLITILFLILTLGVTIIIAVYFGLNHK